MVILLYRNILKIEKLKVIIKNMSYKVPTVDFFVSSRSGQENNKKVYFT